MKLKLLVDTKEMKVVFAEAGSDFVDFLVQMMSLPLTTVWKLLQGRDMMGSIGTLYASMASLGPQHYQDERKDIALNPRAFIEAPLLSVNLYPTGRHTYYTCKEYPDDYFIVHQRLNCSAISSKSSKVYVAAESGYVNENVLYMVMDDLEVKPMSISLVKSRFPAFDSLVETEVKVGKEEGLAILKASLENKNVLTSVFLPRKVKVPKREKLSG